MGASGPGGCVRVWVALLVASVWIAGVGGRLPFRKSRWSWLSRPHRGAHTGTETAHDSTTGYTSSLWFRSARRGHSPMPASPPTTEDGNLNKGRSHYGMAADNLLVQGNTLPRNAVDPIPEGDMWDKRVLMLRGQGLSRSTRILFTPAPEGDGGGELSPPGCIHQHLLNGAIRCIVTAGGGGSSIIGTKWVVHGIDATSGARIDLGNMVYTLRRVGRTYDPLLLEWPKAELDCPKEFPLTAPWKVYENVSFVWTWVNGSDPDEVELRWGHGGETRAGNRFRESDELRHSLRSYYDYVAPWHKGEVIIVTRNQQHRPTWLVGEDALQGSPGLRARFVTHDEFLPASARPTFNSFTIERFLYLIPGLSEYFVYLNDDFFFRRPTHPCDFFLPGPLGGLRVQVGPHRREGLGVGQFPYDWAEHDLSSLRKFHIANVMTWKYLSETYGYTHVHKIPHKPIPMNRDCLEAANRRFSSILQQNKFRHKTDIVPSALHHIYALNEGFRHGVGVYLLHTRMEFTETTFTQLTDRVLTCVKSFSIIFHADWFLSYNLNDDFQTQLPVWLMGAFLKVMHPRPSPLEASLEVLGDQSWRFPEPEQIAQSLIAFGNRPAGFQAIKYVVGLLRMHQHLHANGTSDLPFVGEVLDALLSHNPTWGALKVENLQRVVFMKGGRGVLGSENLRSWPLT